MMTSIILLADIAQDINRGAITERQGTTRVKALVAFVSSALRAGS
jgi:hypothetical protein